MRPELTPAVAARRLWALEATTLTADASRLVVGAEGVIRMPMPCFVIEHERALVLFDTGLHPLARRIREPIGATCSRCCTPLSRPT